MTIRMIRAAIGMAALVGLPLSMTLPPVVKASPVQKAPVWATYNAASKTAHLRVIAGYSDAGNGYNFDGGAAGNFKFTVPLGARVVVRFTNMSAEMPHAAEIVIYTGTLPLGVPAPAPAFAGAATPNYQHGEPPGTSVTFHFTANKAGKYLLICPVHNHVKFGHWDWFIVSKTAKTAKGVLKAA